MTPHPVHIIADLFCGRGLQEYAGEAVSLVDHMLQTATLAEAAGAPHALIATALLHDVGHVLAESGSGDHHAEHGADWTARWFADDVTMPVRLHVDAKRYLCATSGSISTPFRTPHPGHRELQFTISHNGRNLGSYAGLQFHGVSLRNCRARAWLG